VEGSSDLVASAAYQPEAAAVAAARRFVRETLQSWLAAEHAPDGRGLVDDAVLLTSELVTNAVVHAGTPVQVTCKLADGGLEVMVRDSLPASLVPGPVKDENPATERTNGRGLLLPSALASAWGVTYGRAAKAVWFRMGLADAREDTSGDSQPGQSQPGQSQPGQSQPGQSQPGQSGVGQSQPGPWRPARAAGSGYDTLLTRSVESARAALAADAAYALMPDEDGDLRVNAVTGADPAQLLTAWPSVLTAPFLVAGRVTGVLAVAGASPGQFAEGTAQQLQFLADQVAAPLERARLADIEVLRKARAGVAAEANNLLAGPVDQDAIMALAGRAVVPRLSAWCAVLLARPDGTLQPAYVQHAEESRCAALSWVVGRAGPVAPWDDHQPAGRSGPGRAWNLAAADLSGAPPGAVELAAGGAWCVPLVARGRTLGLLAMGSPAAGRLPREAAQLAEDLCRRIALGLDSVRLAARQELTSEALRRTLVPPQMPRIPGIDLAVAHDLAAGGSEAGGDFCDVFSVGEGRWRFAVGEACGPQPEAAAVTSLARNALRILAREGHTIPAVLSRLNELLVDEGWPGKYLTLVHGEIVAGSPARISLACAGQPLPLLLRAPGETLRVGAQPVGAQPVGAQAVDAQAVGAQAVGAQAVGARSAVALSGVAGPAEERTVPERTVPERAVPERAALPQPILGVIEGLLFEAQTIHLAPGDLLLCVTDGVTRRRDGNRLLDDDDGLARLLAGCVGLPADVVAAKVHEEVRSFGGRPAADGMALLAIRAA
jgi:serine phosphatase RsbU (regulator of sigma subunit)/anti-sigma regulatory factor (Ser/Thr protein kinase)